MRFCSCPWRADPLRPAESRTWIERTGRRCARPCTSRSWCGRVPPEKARETPTAVQRHATPRLSTVCRGARASSPFVLRNPDVRLARQIFQVALTHLVLRFLLEVGPDLVAHFGELPLPRRIALQHRDDVRAIGREN